VYGRERRTGHGYGLGRVFSTEVEKTERRAYI